MKNANFLLISMKSIIIYIEIIRPINIPITKITKIQLNQSYSNVTAKFNIHDPKLTLIHKIYQVFNLYPSNDQHFHLYCPLFALLVSSLQKSLSHTSFNHIPNIQLNLIIVGSYFSSKPIKRIHYICIWHILVTHFVTYFYHPFP